MTPQQIDNIIAVQFFESCTKKNIKYIYHCQSQFSLYI